MDRLSDFKLGVVVIMADKDWHGVGLPQVAMHSKKIAIATFSSWANFSHSQYWTAKMCAIVNDTAANCSISLKFYTGFGHMTPEVGYCKNSRSRGQR